jgi:superfamily II DNA or RNA helicase
MLSSSEETLQSLRPFLHLYKYQKYRKGNGQLYSWREPHKIYIEDSEGSLLVPTAFVDMSLEQWTGELNFTVENQGGEASLCPFVPKGPLPIALRDYQKAAFEACLAHSGGIVAHPTGSGKTEIELALANALSEAHTVLIVSPWKSSEDEMTTRAKQYGIPYGRARDLLGDKNKVECDTRIAIGTVQQLAKIRDSIQTDRPFALIYDECQHVSAKTYYGLFFSYLPQRCYGFSATPGRDLFVRSFCGETIHRLTPSDSAIKNVLSSITVVNCPWFSKEIPSYTGNDWAMASDLQFHDARLGAVARIAQRLNENGWTVFIPIGRKEAGKKLVDLIPKSVYWFGNEEIEGDCEDDANFDTLKNLLAEGKVLTLVGTSHLNESVNIPVLGAVILSEGRGERITLQRIGRILRRSKKKRALVLNLGFMNVSLLDFHAKQRLRLAEREFDIKSQTINNTNELQALLEDMKKAGEREDDLFDLDRNGA